MECKSTDSVAAVIPMAPFQDGSLPKPLSLKPEVLGTSPISSQAFSFQREIVLDSNSVTDVYSQIVKFH